MSDKIEDRVILYNQLLNKTYKFYLGKKGKIKIIELIFTEYEFSHLIGLHYLEDKEELSSNNTIDTYNKILNKEITYDTIKESAYFSKIQNRFEQFIYFEELLDESEEIYLYNYKKLKYTKIKAEYLIQCFHNNEEYYIFLDTFNTGENKEKYFCRTFFKRDKVDYTTMQTKYALLRKEKINIETNQIILEQGKPKIRLEQNK